MDPNTALTMIRTQVERFVASDSDSEAISAADDMVEAFAALDQWMTKGGFPPEEWKGRNGNGHGPH